MIEVSGSESGFLWLMDPDPGAEKHVDPVDPDSNLDPQHCLQSQKNPLRTWGEYYQ